MIETTGLEDLMTELSDFAENAENQVVVTMNNLARTLPSELKSQIFREKQSRTGRLRDSIDASSNGTNLSLEMRAYGYFQIFGVAGKKRNYPFQVFGLPESVLFALDGQPKGGDHFKFSNNNNHPGIEGVRAAANTIINLDDLIVNTLLED